MNKKRLITLLVVAGFLLSACSQSNVSNNNTITTSTSSINDGQFTQPDREVDINGVVKSMIGNQITVSIIERQEKDDQVEDDSEEKEAAALTLGTAMPGGGVPGMGGGRNRDESISDEERVQNLLERSTEQKDLLVPVGIPMLKYSGDTEEMLSEEASLEDLKVGSIISVWIDQSIEDRNIAEFVNIR
ncbi:hypothetical protein C0584_05355 [Candidatus Parcubacteria bacterium]|nr:MAG: hypothetical protein C0584_05355 [Candidatus Parcubacteria bacterium]